MKTTERPGAIVSIVLLALGGLALALAAAWNDRLVAIVFNAGQAVSYHFAPIVALAHAIVLVKGIVLLALGALAWWKRRALSAWMRRRRAILLNVATLLVALVLLLAIGEVVARIALHGETYDGGGAGLKDELAGIAFNSRGFRDAEVPPGKTVILALGDSFTFGQGIKDESELWTEVLERDLGDAYTVVNTGQNGFQTYDEWRTLNASLDLGPRIVILQYFFNDAETDAQLTSPAVVQMTPLQKIAKGAHLFLYSNSYLYSFVYIRWQNARINLGLAPNYPDVIDAVYRDHAGELGMHERQLLGIKRTAEEHGARFILLVVPANYDFAHYPLEDGHAFIARFCAAYNVSCIDLLPAFRDEDYTLTRVSPYDAHPSAYGHARIAHAIGESAIFKNALASARADGEEQVVAR